MSPMCVSTQALTAGKFSLAHHLLAHILALAERVGLEFTTSLPVTSV
jgi:hypothetical protein